MTGDPPNAMPEKEHYALSKKSQRITHLSTARSAPTWTFGAKTGAGALGQGAKSSGQDPGKYGAPSTDLKYSRLPNVSFGTAEQRPGGGASRRRAEDNKKQHDEPGPGSYSPLDPNQTRSQFGFGTASRMPKNKKSAAPPPGTYEVSGAGLSKKGVMMASRMAGGRSMSVPGPGAYTSSIDYTKESSPSIGMVKDKRRPLVLDTKVPGPGTYGAPGSLTGWGAPAFSMKGKYRMGKSDSTPGPIFAPYSQFSHNETF